MRARMEASCKQCSSVFMAYHKCQTFCSDRCRRRGETMRGLVRDYAAKRREALQAMKVTAGCSECGYNAHACALHFDHRDPAEKSFTISQDPKRAWASILAEVAKCRVLCANCHAVKTYREGDHHAKNLLGH